MTTGVSLCQRISYALTFFIQIEVKWYYMITHVKANLLFMAPHVQHVCLHDWSCHRDLTNRKESKQMNPNISKASCPQPPFGYRNGCRMTQKQKQLMIVQIVKRTPTLLVGRHWRRHRRHQGPRKPKQSLRRNPRPLLQLKHCQRKFNQNVGMKRCLWFLTSLVLHTACQKTRGLRKFPKSLRKLPVTLLAFCDCDLNSRVYIWHVPAACFEKMTTWHVKQVYPNGWHSKGSVKELGTKKKQLLEQLAKFLGCIQGSFVKSFSFFWRSNISILIKTSKR